MSDDVLEDLSCETTSLRCELFDILTTRTGDIYARWLIARIPKSRDPTLLRAMITVTLLCKPGQHALCGRLEALLDD